MSVQTPQILIEDADLEILIPAIEVPLAAASPYIEIVEGNLNPQTKKSLRGGAGFVIVDDEPVVKPKKKRKKKLKKKVLSSPIKKAEKLETLELEPLEEIQGLNASLAQLSANLVAKQKEQEILKSKAIAVAESMLADEIVQAIIDNELASVRDYLNKEVQTIKDRALNNYLIEMERAKKEVRRAKNKLNIIRLVAIGEI